MQIADLDETPGLIFISTGLMTRILSAQATAGGRNNDNKTGNQNAEPRSDNPSHNIQLCGWRTMKIRTKETFNKAKKGRQICFTASSEF